MVLQWIERVFATVRPTPEETEALRRYIKSEYRLAALQGRAADQFNSVAARCAVAVLSDAGDDATKAEMVEAADCYVQAVRAISTEHDSLTPPPPAAEAFLAHGLLYRDYMHWGEAQQLKYRAAPWFSPDELETVKKADKALKESKRRADREKVAVMRAARISAADIMEIMRDVDRA
jgi:hypothetical protein